MTALELELLNKSMDGLGNAFQRNREMDIQRELTNRRLDLESQREATQTSRYDAQQAHFERMEAAQQSAAEKAAQAATDRAAFLKTQAASKDALVKFTDYQKTQKEYVQLLGQQVAMNQKNPKKGLTNDEAHAQFVSHLQDMAVDNGEMFDRLKQDPKIGLMLKPEFDWSTVGNPTGEPGLKTFTDDHGHAQTGTYVPGPKGGGKFHPIPKDTSAGTVQQTIKQVPNSVGGGVTSLTNTVTRTPLVAQAAAAPVSQPPPQPDPAAILRQSASAQSPTASQPGQQHIAYLLAHPETAPLFDVKFGQGAAAKYLQATQQ
jgi:hypothetical protein